MRIVFMGTPEFAVPTLLEMSKAAVYRSRSIRGRLFKDVSRGRDEQVKFLRAKVTTGTGFPGTLLTKDMRIACGDGAVEILQVQRPSRSIVSGRELVRGARLAPGVIFERSHGPSLSSRL
jgi:methionyl-tRNA formyltransferase